mmetsp:Transcript_18014/g.37512  ORF Transcript_18014/g.37512 Transcript_18014/m.37512 type:complete len:156 (-) Transcript_18014:31-498(-)
MAVESDEAPARWRRRDREASSTCPPDVDAIRQYVKQAESPPSSIGGGAQETAPSLVSVQTPEPPKPLEAPRSRLSEPCSVCLEGFEKTDEGRMPRTCRRCGNSFHQACLSEWARKEQQIKWEQKPWMLPSQFESGSCPCCRSNRGHDRSRRWTKK